MFGISTSKEKGELVLILDIRSSSVGGALVLVSKSNIPKILFSARETLAQESDINIEKFLPATLKSLDKVVSKLFKAGLGAPKNIYCVLSSPWYVSQTRFVNLKQDKTFLFSVKLADDLIKKEVEVFKQEYLAKYPDLKHEMRLVELRNIKTMLNGYESHEPLDQKVSEVDMSLFVSMSPEEVTSGIEKVTQKYFHQDKINFVSNTMAAFAVVRNIFKDQADFLLIDVDAVITNISMVKKNVLRESISFTIGTNYIVRGLASALSVTEGEAESYISLFMAGHAEEPTNLKLQPIVDKLKNEWLKNFQESLANLSKDISVPYTIYLSTKTNFGAFFSKIIETEQFNQYTLTESKFKIIFLDTETLHDTVSFENETFRDPFIMVDASYINHFLI